MENLREKHTLIIIDTHLVDKGLVHISVNTHHHRISKNWPQQVLPCLATPIKQVQSHLMCLRKVLGSKFHRRRRGISHYLLSQHHYEIHCLNIWFDFNQIYLLSTFTMILTQIQIDTNIAITQFKSTQKCVNKEINTY